MSLIQWDSVKRSLRVENGLEIEIVKTHWKNMYKCNWEVTVKNKESKARS